MAFVGTHSSTRGLWRFRARLAAGAAYALLLSAPLAFFHPLAAPASSGTLGIFVAPGLHLSDIACVGVLLAGALCYRRRYGLLSITLPILALVILAVVAAAQAKAPLLASYVALRWLIALGLLLSLLQIGPLPERLAAVFLYGMAVHAAVGIAQAIIQGPLGLPGEQAIEAEQSGAAIIAVGGLRWLRAYGLAFHPNVLGGYLAIALLLALPLLQHLRFRLLWLLLWAALLLSFSRSAWLALAATLPPLAFYLWRRHPALRRSLLQTAAVSGLLLLVIGALCLQQVAVRFSPAAVAEEARSFSERAALIAIALQSIIDTPLSGVGAGNFPLLVEAIGAPVIPQPVHNVPLLLAAEVGLPGGLLWIWLWVAPLLALDARRGGGNRWPAVLAAAWLAWGLISLWDDYPWGLETGRLLSVVLLAAATHSLMSISPAPGVQRANHPAGG